MALLSYIQKQVDNAYLPLKEGMTVFPLPLTCILAVPHVGRRSSLNIPASECNETLKSSNSSAEKEKTENVRTSRAS